MPVPRMEVYLRDKNGTGPARALRRSGRVPAVVYGGGGEPASVSLDGRKLFRAVAAENFFATVFQLHTAESEAFAKVLPRAIQRHPVTDAILHLDLLRVADQGEVRVFVPVRFANQDKCFGLKLGGVLNIVRRKLELYCPADSIPETVVVDLAQVKMGDSIHISHVPLPPGVRPALTDRDFTIATVSTPKGMTQAEADEEEASAGTQAPS